MGTMLHITHYHPEYGVLHQLFVVSFHGTGGEIHLLIDRFKFHLNFNCSFVGELND